MPSKRAGRPLYVASCLARAAFAYPRHPGRQAVGQADAPVVLVPVDVKPVMFVEQLERSDLVRQREADAADLAGIPAVAVRELVDKRGL